jgi:hypothetical protein
MARALIAEILPEYKYSFIFRGALEECVLPELRIDGKPSAWQPRRNITAFPLAPDAIPVQFEFLKAFLDQWEPGGPAIIILEGQYNPVRYKDAEAALNRVVRERMAALSSRYPFVEYHPRGELLAFRRSDYLDDVHVNQLAGVRFTSDFFSRVLRMPAAASADSRTTGRALAASSLPSR